MVPKSVKAWAGQWIFRLYKLHTTESVDPSDCRGYRKRSPRTITRMASVPVLIERLSKVDERGQYIVVDKVLPTALDHRGRHYESSRLCHPGRRQDQRCQAGHH